MKMKIGILILAVFLCLLAACTSTDRPEQEQAEQQEVFQSINYSVPCNWVKDKTSNNGVYYTVDEEKESYFDIDYEENVLESKNDDESKKDYFEEVRNSLRASEKKGDISNVKISKIDQKYPYCLIQYDYIYNKQKGTIYVCDAIMFIGTDCYAFSFSTKDRSDINIYLNVVNSVMEKSQ